MKSGELAKLLEKGEIGPLYYFYGDEPYLMEKMQKSLLERVVSPDFRDFNLDVFHGNECRGDEIASVAQTLPMFTDRRLVLVKRAADLTAAALEILVSYVSNPSPATCLVFLGEKIDQRKKFFQEIKKKGELVEFKKPYENQLGTFIRDEARILGKKIDAAAVEMLVYLVGANLHELASQLEKVASYVGGRELITLEDVKGIVSDTKVESVFEFANALGLKELGKALRSMHTILRDGEAPLYILAMVARHFRQLWKVREQMAKKVPQQEIARATGINPYFLNGIMGQARNFEISDLKGIFEALFAADLALKSGGRRPVLVLERLVMDICSEGGKG